MSALYTTRPVPVISISDMAIDEAATGRDALYLYAETRDPEMIGVAVKFFMGERPSVFKCVRVTTSQIDQIERTVESEKSQNRMAFMLGVIGVDRFWGCDDTEHLDWAPKYITDPQPKQAKVMSTDEFNLFPEDVAEEIGSVIKQRAPLVRGRPVSFVVPLSSAAALGRRYRASLRSAGTPNHGTPPSAATAPSLMDGPSTSESAGDAPATASPT